MNCISKHLLIQTEFVNKCLFLIKYIYIYKFNTNLKNECLIILQIH